MTDQGQECCGTDSAGGGETPDLLVTYDPSKADVATLIAATAKYGFPTQVLVQ